MTKTAEEIQRGLQAPIPPELVKAKPGAVNGNQAMAIFYIDARTVMDRLDDVLGIGGWQDHYEAMEGGMVKCRISIRIGGEWLSREDAGRESAQPDKGDRGKSAFCLPMDAQALTKDGWKLPSEIIAGEPILGFDLAARECRWTRVSAMNVFLEPQPVMEMRSKSFNMDCTPGHRWLVDRRGSPVRLKPLSDLDSCDKIIVAAPAESGGHPLTPREAAIIGWLATDGSVRVAPDSRPGRGPTSHLNAFIHQSKAEERKLIRELLGEDGVEYVAPPGERLFPGHDAPSATMERGTYHLKTGFAKTLLHKAGLYDGGPIDWRRLSGLVTRLGAEARAAMFQAMLAGDGQRSHSSKQVRFGKKRKPGVLDAFEILCTLQGIALGTLHGSDSAGKVPLRTLRQNPHTWNKCLEVTPGTPQPVWCPTTPLGTWVVKWNGQITITGNSDAFKRCAVKWGIGRELYGMKAQWADYDPQKKRFVNPPRIPVANRRSTLGISPASRPETLSNGHAPAAEPEKVLTVGEWVWKQAALAKKAGIGLEGDELADHVLEELKKDWGSDMHQWPDDAMPDAKRAAQDFAMRAKRCKGDPFRKARPEELQPLTEAVAAPGGVTWGEVVKAMDWPPAAVPSGLSLENLRDALDYLAEKAGAAKDRAKAKQQLAGSR